MKSLASNLRKALHIFLAILILFFAVIPMSPVASAAVTDTKDVSSITPPDGYKPTNEDSNLKYSQRKMLKSDDNSPADILLVQDNLPWDSRANETVLSRLGYNYDKVTVSQLSLVDLSAYKVLILANDQTLGTYNNFKQFRDNVDLFCNYGGVVVYGACDSGWADGTIDWDLPGGLKKESMYTYYNYIADGTNPIVTGELTDNRALTNADLYNNYCSHGYFIESTLPPNASIILRSSDNGAPTLVQYPMGSGYIIASTLTWEHAYEYEHGKYARVAMDDYFAYALTLANGVTYEADKMIIGIDNNSFRHNSSSFFYENEMHYDYSAKGMKGRYFIDSDLFEKLCNLYKAEAKLENRAVNSNLLVQKRDASWGGSCFGISTSMALEFVHSIDINNFDKNAENYYSLGLPKDNSRLRSLINYYQICQYVPSVSSGKIYDGGNINKELSVIVSLAKQSERSGIPFIFLFGWKYTKTDGDGKDVTTSAGHAIVCIGIEKKDDGSYRLQFVDPNSTGAYVYANVPADYSGITFESIYLPASNGGNYRDYKLKDVGHLTLSSLANVDIDGANNDLNVLLNKNARKAKTVGAVLVKNDVFVFNSTSEFVLSSGDETLCFQNGELSGTMEMVSVKKVYIGETTDYEVIIPHHEVYSIESLNGNASFSLFDSAGDYYGFTGNGVEQIDFDMGSEIQASGNEMQFSAYCGLSNSEADMLKIESRHTSDFSIEADRDELIIAGDNLADMSITGFGSDHKEFNLPFEADGNQATINVEEIFVPDSTEYLVSATTDGGGAAFATPGMATENTRITLTAEALPGYSFDYWEVIEGPDGIIKSINSPVVQIFMPGQNVSVKAHFKFISDTGNTGKGGCYVATCVYGSYDCPEVWTLRRFRDETLAKTWYGRAFIHTYYAISPTIVKWFGDTDWFKNMWRGTLDKMVQNLNAQGVPNTAYDDIDW